MKIILFIVFLAFQLHCLGQTSKMFEVKEVFTGDTLHKKTAVDFQIGNPNFFEDDKYLVRKTCSGEWGGTIWFKNKITGTVYSCSATCPVVVNKLNGKYIVTNTLAHLRGSSEILEITDPQSMDIFKMPKPRRKIGKRIFRYVGDNESRSTKGSQKMVDTIGVLTLASFQYKGQLFHVITDFRKTFIAKIQDKKFLTVDTISNKSIWTYNPEVIKTINGHSIVLFHNEQTEGYLDIFGNNITLIRYR